MPLEKINVAEISPGKQNNNRRETLHVCSQKENKWHQRGRQAAPTRLYGKIYAHYTVCLESVRAQGIWPVKSNSSNSSVQSELTVITDTLEKIITIIKKKNRTS